MEYLQRKGAVGALLDIYEQAIAALKDGICDISPEQLVFTCDAFTMDENCRSAQTILTHVVHAGYGYATSIKNNIKPGNLQRPEKKVNDSIALYLDDLDNVFWYTENVFQNIKDDDLEQKDNTLKIKTNWDQEYDIEQMMEHAIVHILRHYRQIQKFKMIFSK